mgnify:CR=1 FL=1
MTKLLTYIFIFLFTFTSSVNADYFVKSESGLTVAGSIYSIQDSARKIYSWVEGEGYKGNTTYVDPISGEVHTSDAMLKDGVVDLATAAAISGAFKIGGKVVGKTGKSVKDTVNSIDDILKKNSQFITYPDGISVKTATKNDILNAVEKVKGSNYISSVNKNKAIEWKNIGNLLPKGEYIETDIIKHPHKYRGFERLIIEKNSGKVYYTNDHYKTFYDITKEVTKGK